MQLKNKNNSKIKHEKIIKEKLIKYKNLKLNDLEKRLLFETYIKYIETTENTSNRRILLNTTFYLTLIIALFSLTIFIVTIQPWMGFVLSLVLILICIIWFLTINYYKNLNTAKFDIMKIVSEKLMKTSIFDDEYDIYKILQLRYKFYRFTNLEIWIPIIFIILSIGIFIASIVLMCL